MTSVRSLLSTENLSHVSGKPFAETKHRIPVVVEVSRRNRAESADALLGERPHRDCEHRQEQQGLCEGHNAQYFSNLLAQANGVGSLKHRITCSFFYAQVQAQTKTKTEE